MIGAGAAVVAVGAGTWWVARPKPAPIGFAIRDGELAAARAGQGRRHEATALVAIAVSTKPVIASHVHVHGKHTHPRFISRELANAVVSKGGGLVGAWPAGIGISDLRGFVDRALELVEIAGIDHVCLGTDMDANYKPVFDTYAHLPHFVAGLAQQGLAEPDIARLIGGNYLRLLAAVQSGA